MAKNNDRITLEEVLDLIPKPVTAMVSLPSKGLFYDNNLVPNGMVEVTPMSAREEKLVAGMRGGNVEEVIDVILKRCLKTNIATDDLLTTDRFFLLLALRANSYGEDYNFELTCGYCNVSSKYTVKIPGDLEVKYAEDSDAEPFFITLPISKIKIGFDLLREKDMKEIRRFASKETKKGFLAEGDPAYSYRIAKQIVSVNDRSLDMLTALELVNRLPAKDSAVLKNAFDKKTPGVMTGIQKDCVSCGKTIETDLPMSAEFFRPDDGE